jgi:Fic family protein
MTLQEQLQQIDQLKTDIEALRPLSPELERRIMDKFRLDWTYHSNAIEGNTLTYGETKAFLLHGITAAGKPFRDYLDIKGHHAALDTLQEIIRQDRVLTESDIRELHKIILVEPYRTPAMTPDGVLTTRPIQPGQYKTTPNHVQTSTGEIHYYATPEETPARMGDLMAWYRREWEGKQTHPLILATTFHYRFVTIHPFDDGNGRMSRFLMNLMLMQAGFPPVIIPKEIKNDYLLTLEKADTDDDLGPFILLIGECLLVSMKLYLRGAKGEIIEEIGDLDKKLDLLEKQLQLHEKRKDIDYEVAKRLDLYDRLLKPFLSLLFLQLSKFNRLFMDNEFRYFIYFIRRDSSDIETGRSVEVFWKQLEEELKKTTLVRTVDFRYGLKKLLNNDRYSLEIVWNLIFDETSFDLHYSIRPRDNRKTRFELLHDEYGQSYSQTQIEELVLRCINDLYDLLQASQK